MSQKNIPYGFQTIENDDIDAVGNVLKSDLLTTGPKVAEFETALSNYVNANYAIVANSGTSALDMAVAALGLKPNSEIITTPFTFVASSNCILYNNCKPIFADINKETYNIDTDQIRKKITKKTKAIVYVDYAGQPCEIDELKKIAQDNDLFLIEDACHAFGAEYKGKRIGSLADMTIFSFHPVKHITTGEGGAVTTNNDEFYKKLKLLRNHGIDKPPSERADYSYDVKMLGRNYRITDFQCALGISQLKKIDRFLKRREEIAKRYKEELVNTDKLTIPYVMPNVKHAWHLYPIMVDKKINRDTIFTSMRQKGIGVNVHYIPIYKFSHYKQFGFIEKNYPTTEDIFSRILSIPIYPKMTDQDVDTVIREISNSLRG
ncbi:Aspartate aminotransferase [Candidatus Bilamarchaeum dharawalense]|uniref:Aspartate aminotransferase n=1 Tax=Candidatus Bilamarchaeum dharawalense TaxID=2885759 RepID=A0A5E4LTU6_9ARCH|nr:Aspartate aminotransferase [Candidatus Bilamarchaeum dharawalense]